MSEIKFTCTRFTRVTEEILRGSNPRTAIHVALRETLGENYDMEFLCYTDIKGLEERPFAPEGVMLATAENKWFAVYTEDGRLLSAGRNKYLTRGNEDLYLPEGVTCLHKRCLSSNLMSIDTLHLPSRVFLAERCFEELSVQKIVYPEEGFCAYPGYIPARAFAGSHLTEMTVWDGAYSISNEAFKGCRHLKTVSLPSSLTHIGENAFSGCPGDLKIIFRGTRAQWESVHKSEAKVTSKMHYDNSRVGYDYADESRQSSWIDFDTYTVDCTA